MIDFSDLFTAHYLRVALNSRWQHICIFYFWVVYITVNKIGVLIVTELHLNVVTSVLLGLDD